MNIKELKNAVEQSDMEGEAIAELLEILSHYVRLSGEKEG